jgi:hypothetical protein
MREAEARAGHHGQHGYRSGKRQRARTGKALPDGAAARHHAANAHQHRALAPSEALVGQALAKARRNAMNRTLLSAFVAAALLLAAASTSAIGKAEPPRPHG